MADEVEELVVFSDLRLSFIEVPLLNKTSLLISLLLQLLEFLASLFDLFSNLTSLSSNLILCLHVLLVVISHSVVVLVRHWVLQYLWVQMGEHTVTDLTLHFGVISV